MTDVIGPDGLDMGVTNPRRKFRWVVRLYKDAKQVRPAEFLSRCQRPPLTIHGTADKIWNGGGEILMTFRRTDVEQCDEIWLALYDGCGVIVEEWELLDVRAIPMRLFTSHIPGDEEYEDEPGEQTVKYMFDSMRYKAADEKWTNFSTLGKGNKMTADLLDWKRQSIFDGYVEQAAAFCTGKGGDELLMRGLEEIADIIEQGAYDFRMKVCAIILEKLLRNEPAKWHTMPSPFFDSFCDAIRHQTNGLNIKTISSCTCDIVALMQHGCKCGHLTKG